MYCQYLNVMKAEAFLRPRTAKDGKMEVLMRVVVPVPYLKEHSFKKNYCETMLGMLGNY